MKTLQPIFDFLDLFFDNSNEIKIYDGNDMSKVHDSCCRHLKQEKIYNPYNHNQKNWE